MSEQNIYDEMAAYIREHGWTQGRPVDDRGRVCLLGAYRKVVRSGRCRPASEELNVLAEVLRGGPVSQQFSGMAIWTWNDKPGRRKRDVLKALEKASEQLEAAQAKKATEELA